MKKLNFSQTELIADIRRQFTNNSNALNTGIPARNLPVLTFKQPVVDAQNVADLGPQLRHVVAIPLLAELAKAAEILADLGGGDVHLVPQGAGRDAHHALVVQVIQIPVIPGQPVDDCVRNFLLFHRIFLFLPEQPAVYPLRRVLST